MTLCVDFFELGKRIIRAKRFKARGFSYQFPLQVICVSIFFFVFFLFFSFSSLLVLFFSLLNRVFTSLSCTPGSTRILCVDRKRWSMTCN